MTMPGARAAANLTWDGVLAWRLRRQLIDPVGAAGIVGTVRRLCGVQAQVPSSAELALALRSEDPQPGGASRALAERTLMRTWAMRGTLHLLTPDDAGAYLALIAARRTWERPAWQRNFGASAAEVQTLAGVVDDVLDGTVMDRDELIAAIADRTGNRNLDEHLRSGWGALLKPLAWMGLICNGPNRGNRVTFTSPRSWLPQWRGLPDTHAAARIAITSYLRAYGPATAKTFDAWLTRGSSRSADVRDWFEAIADELVTVDVEGQACHALASDLDELREAKPTSAVRLLAGFDQYLLGPGTSDPRIISPERRRLVSKAAGWIAPVVLRGGRVVGVWERGERSLDVALFTEQDASVDRATLETEAERVSRCLGDELPLSVGTI
jgi:hypothetical protein